MPVVATTVFISFGYGFFVLGVVRMNRTARLDFDPLSRPAYVPMVSSVVAKARGDAARAACRRAQAEGAAEKGIGARVEPQHAEGTGMKTRQKLTPWIDGHIKPVRKGCTSVTMGLLTICRTHHFPDGMGNNGLRPTIRLTKHFQ